MATRATLHLPLSQTSDRSPRRCHGHAKSPLLPPTAAAHSPTATLVPLLLHPCTVDQPGKAMHVAEHHVATPASAMREFSSAYPDATTLPNSDRSPRRAPPAIVSRNLRRHRQITTSPPSLTQPPITAAMRATIGTSIPAAPPYHSPAYPLARLCVERQPPSTVRRTATPTASYIPATSPSAGGAAPLRADLPPTLDPHSTSAGQNDPTSPSNDSPSPVGSMLFHILLHRQPHWRPSAQAPVHPPPDRKPPSILLPHRDHPCMSCRSPSTPITEPVIGTFTARRPYPSTSPDELGRNCHAPPPYRHDHSPTLPDFAGGGNPLSPATRSAPLLCMPFHPHPEPVCRASLSLHAPRQSGRPPIHRPIPCHRHCLVAAKTSFRRPASPSTHILE